MPHHSRIRVDILDVTGSPWHVLEGVLRHANDFEIQTCNVAHSLAIRREKTGEIFNMETPFFFGVFRPSYPSDRAQRLEQMTDFHRQNVG